MNWNQALPMVTFFIGLLHFKRGNIQEAVRILKRVHAIDPNNTEALNYLSYIYSFLGKGFAAEPFIKKLLRIDPLTPLYHFYLGFTPLLEGKFEAALDLCRKSYQMEPDNPLYRLWYAIPLAWNEQFQEAYSIFDLLGKEAPQHIASLSLFLKYALRGEKTKALKSVTEELKIASKWDEQFSWLMAGSFALIDEKDEALYWLENAVNRGCINYPLLSEIDPFLENIRGEERFKKLMERVKYEWENFEV